MTLLCVLEQCHVTLLCVLEQCRELLSVPAHMSCAPLSPVGTVELCSAFIRSGHVRRNSPRAERVSSDTCKGEGVASPAPYSPPPLVAVAIAMAQPNHQAWEVSTPLL